MLDKKYERYWDELDIDEELLKILDDEYSKMKKEDNAFYRYTRSSDNMGDELVYKKSRDNVTHEEHLEESPKSVYLQKIISVEAKLTRPQKIALILYALCGYKHHEIAEILGCTRQNVTLLISRAKAKIRKNLNK